MAVSDDAALLDALGDAAVEVHGGLDGRGAGVRRGARARAPAARGRRPPRRSPRACAAPAACSSARRRGTAFGDYVAGSNHTLPTGGAARFASGLSARHFRRRMAEVRARRPPRPRWRGPARRSRAPRASPGTPPRWRSARIPARERAHRRDRAPDGGDQRLPAARPGRDRRGHARAPASASSTTCWTCWPATARLDLDVQRAGRPADGLAPHGRGHRDRARAGARPRARRAPRDRPLRPRGGPDGRGARGVRDRRLRPPVLLLRGLRAACRRATSRASSTRRRRSSSAPWRPPRG